MSKLPGVFSATKKDGSTYFRASITHNGKHISLGSFNTEQKASQAYKEASYLLSSDTPIEKHDKNSVLSYNKWISLINFRDNKIYCKTPIYIFSNYFHYYFDKDDYLKFDVDDLFYYSKHTIQRRGGHLFVADFGTQYNILSRYGIKNFAVAGKDYRFVNGDTNDYRYANIEVINKYHGVSKQINRGISYYTAKIHINGDYQIGTYQTEAEAAVAYNKAAIYLKEHGFTKNFPMNYVLELNEIEYATIFNRISISKNIRNNFQ